MFNAPWLSILKNLAAEHKKETTFSLATLSSLAPPTIANRSLVFRSFVDGSTSLLTTTDVRSSKVRELRDAADGHGSICWWMPTPNVQFRIRGTVRVIEPNDASWDDQRKETWSQMSGHLRATFARPRPPGSPMESYDEGNDWVETIPATEEDAESDDQKAAIRLAKSNFALLVVDPTFVDLVELAVVPNKHTVWTLQGEAWKEEILVP